MPMLKALAACPDPELIRPDMAKYSETPLVEPVSCLGSVNSRPRYGRIGTRMNTSLVCDDVEATYRQLSERGVEFVSPPQKQPWGTFAIMKDSEGNRFVISSD